MDEMIINYIYRSHAVREVEEKQRSDGTDGGRTQKNKAKWKELFSTPGYRGNSPIGVGGLPRLGWV